MNYMLIPCIFAGYLNETELIFQPKLKLISLGERGDRGGEVGAADIEGDHREQFGESFLKQR